MIPDTEAVQPDYSTMSIRTFVRQAAKRLDETELGPRTHLHTIVEWYGFKRVITWIEEAERIEAAGGEMLPDGSRRRTLGGIFFRVVCDAISSRDRQYLFPKQNRKIIKALAKADQPCIEWADRYSVINEAPYQIRKIISVKITIVAEIDKAIERESFTLLKLQYDGNIPILPKGIPIPPQPMPTNYIVYIGHRQWAKVKQSLTNPEDVLIIEGIPIIDPKYNAITVYATKTDTKVTQVERHKAEAHYFKSRSQHAKTEQ